MVYNSNMARPSTTEPQDFGALLADLRKSKGLTQIQLAERLESSQQMVDYYERRAANPTVKTIQKIAGALEVAVSELTVQSYDVKNKPGPKSAIEKRFEKVRSLPKPAQKMILEVVDAMLAQHEHKAS
jgi:transcriptional regulator with XRE-family HTH domain